MNAARTIAGYEVNLVLSKTGAVREAGVLVGSSDCPGMRAKDGPEASVARKAAREAVAAELGLPLSKVRAVARYSELSEQDGMVVRRNSAGKIVGVYEV